MTINKVIDQKLSKLANKNWDIEAKISYFDFPWVYGLIYTRKGLGESF